jgi:hypothetical protein
MRFNTSILLSLLALESVVGAPAPQYESESVVASSAAGSAGASPSMSAPASANVSAGAGTKSCKAKGDKPKWGQLWGEHRRPRVRPSASAPAPAGDEGGFEIPIPTGAPDPRPAASVVFTEIAAGASEASPSDTSPSEIEMPSAIESAPVVVTATAIEAGAGDGYEQPAYAEVAPSPVTSAVTQPSPVAEGGNLAPGGFEADILKAHNVFRATYGMLLPSISDVEMADKQALKR